MVNRIKNHLLTALQAQLVLTLASLPILINWGLPISYMTFFGNLFFTPILMVFIFTSSLLFFTQLCNIPNGLMVLILEKTTQLWNFLLQFGSKSWLVSFVHPGKIPLAIIGACIVAVLIISTRYSLYKRLIFLSTMLGLLIAGFIGYNRSIYQPTSFYDKECIISYHKTTGLHLTDKGYFAHKKTPDKAVLFELRPYLIKTYGRMDITTLTLTRIGVRSLQGALTLCKLCSIKKIQLPYFEKPLSKYGWALFFALKNYATEHEIVLQRKVTAFQQKAYPHKSRYQKNSDAKQKKAVA